MQRLVTALVTSLTLRSCSSRFGRVIAALEERLSSRPLEKIRRAHTTVAAACCATAVLTGAAASAQTAPPAAAGVIDSQHAWTVQAGHGPFTLRDVSRNTRPPDASPIAWKGAGPTVLARFETDRVKSSHQVAAGFRQARGFSYEGPARSVDAPHDGASQLSARYVYQRYIWRDLGLDGFDLGLGAEGIGSREVLDRRITASLRSTTTIAGGGGAAVIVARLRRWDRVHLGATWSNGAIVSRRIAEHSARPDSGTFSGGNFLTGSEVRAGVKLTAAARLSISWRRDFEYYASDHYSYSGVWQSFNVGVLYAR